MNPNENWIFSGPRNGLFVRIDGKAVALRYSVHQSRAYADYLDAAKKKIDARLEDAKKNPDGAAKFNHASQLREVVLDTLDIAVIAFNPEPDKLEYPREVLETKLDADQLKIIAEEWQKRKIYDPQASRPSDPLQPQTVEAAK